MLSFIRFFENTLITFFLSIALSNPDPFHFRSIVTKFWAWTPHDPRGLVGAVRECWTWCVTAFGGNGRNLWVSGDARKFCVLSARVIAKKSRHGLPQVSLKNLITLQAFVGDSRLLLKYSLKRIFYQQHELWSSRFGAPSVFPIPSAVILLPRHSA